MTHADRLARFPNELRLLRPMAPRLLYISVAAVLLFVCLNSERKVVWLFGSIFCGLAILWCAVSLLPGMYSVVLRRDALVITGLFRRRAYPWSQLGDFIAFEQGLQACVAFRNSGRPTDGQLGGRNANVLPLDSMTTIEMAALLSQWRELAVADQTRGELRDAATSTLHRSQPAARPEPAMEITPLSLHSARLLAGFPNAQVIGSLGPFINAALVAMIFALGTIVALVYPSMSSLVIFAIVLPLTILGIRRFGLQNAIKLDRDGIEIFRGWRRWRHSWESVQDFAPVRFNSLRGSSVDEFVAFSVVDEPTLWMLERADRPRSPTTQPAYVFRNTLLPGNYRLPAPELANLLTKWRTRALAAAHDRSAAEDVTPNVKIA